jgi:hypothetical protein
MDELSVVRVLLDEPAPSPEVVEEGRQRLVGGPARRAPRSRRVGLWSAMVFGLTGAAAAAAIAAAILISGAGASPGGGASSAGDGALPAGGGAALAPAHSARSVLLAAAVHAASPSTSGRYWHVRSMSKATVPRKFGHGDNRYTLEQLSVTEKWTTHAGRNWLGRRDWERPKRPQDETAWKRDGAPRKWCIGQTDTAPPQPICLRTAPGTASLTRVGRDTFQITEGHDLTFKQLQQLPTDAEALRAWLVGIARHDLDPSASTAVVNLNVETELENLLVDFPVPPSVRAAALRALADMPGVTSIGSTEDELGRPGVGIRIEGPIGVFVSDGGPVVQRAGKVSRTLIIDPETSYVLQDQTRVGDHAELTIDTLMLDVGWTNESPTKPALPGGAARAAGTASA